MTTQEIEISAKDTQEVIAIFRDKGLFNEVDWTSSTTFEVDIDNEFVLEEIQEIIDKTGLEIFMPSKEG